MSEQSTLATEVRFAGSDTAYTLYVSPRLEAENVAVRALGQMAPWLLLALLIFSLLCALVYSRYITRPIVRLSGIAGRMSELDFNWECPEQRRDEIGALGRSLNCMSRRLSHRPCQIWRRQTMPCAARWSRSVSLTASAWHFSPPPHTS